MGYIDCVEEIISHGIDFDHVVFACGSGGTVAGLAIGMRLAGLKARLHAVGVCDSPDYFYNHIEEVATALNIDTEKFGSVRTWCHLYQGQGIGYARSTTEELQYVIEVGRKTGVVLDPVYSGKALYHFVNKVLKDDPSIVKPGDKVLFIHTGGSLGLYDKEEQLLPLLPADQVQRLDIR
jgi:1-aminocyclopropane-1-carboxylate deaminase/D-cysteine desulfhydrase-like pyridoxal-dependent ACC family enzyme